MVGDASTRIIGWLAQLDGPGVRRVCGLAAAVATGVVVLAAIRVWFTPFMTLREYVGQNWIAVTGLFASWLVWSGVVLAAYRNQPTDPGKHKGQTLQRIYGAAGSPWILGTALLVTALAGLAWAAAPAPWKIAKVSGVFQDTSDFECDTELQFDDSGKANRGTIAQAGLQSRGPDECGAFVQRGAVQELTVYQGGANQSLQIFLSIGDSDCSLSPPRRESEDVYFADGAIEADSWSYEGRFLTRECLVVGPMKIHPARADTGTVTEGSPRQTVRLRFAFAWDCTTFPSPDSAPSAPISLLIKNGAGSVQSRLAIDLSDEHRRQYVASCRAQSDSQ